MRYLLTSLLCVFTLSLTAQVDCQGPDFNNDSIIGAADIIVFLSYYGNEWPLAPEFVCGETIAHQDYAYSTEVGWMLPNIPPTGKRVEIPLVVIVGFKDGKVTHEHIYWDQASVLVQIGLLSPHGLPVNGIETAKRMEKINNRMKL